MWEGNRLAGRPATPVGKRSQLSQSSPLAVLASASSRSIWPVLRLLSPGSGILSAVCGGDFPRLRPCSKEEFRHQGRLGQMGRVEVVKPFVDFDLCLGQDLGETAGLALEFLMAEGAEAEVHASGVPGQGTGIERAEQGPQQGHQGGSPIEQ